MVSATAAGGVVKMFGSDGVQIADFNTGGQVFDLAKVGRGAGKGLLMRLSWDNGSPLEASGAAAYAKLNPGQEQPIKYGKEGEAELTYQEGGFLSVQAQQNKFKMKIQGLNGISVELDEGDKVSFTLDLKKGTFVITTDPDNQGQVIVDTGSDFAPVMNGGKAMNFNVGNDGSLVATSGGQLLYYSPAGDFLAQLSQFDRPTPYSRLDTPIPAVAPSKTTKPTIIQPIVSVVR